jgi:hypothetical protein
MLAGEEAAGVRSTQPALALQFVADHAGWPAVEISAPDSLTTKPDDDTRVRYNVYPLESCSMDTTTVA